VAAGCPDRGVTVVAGIASWRGMGIEGATLRAHPADEGPAGSGGGAPPRTAVAGRTTYHGAFALSLPPGRWRIEGEGAVPSGRGSKRLRGSVVVEVRPGSPRVDRVSLLLEESVGKGVPE
jgi:hypothetical protein